MCENEDQKPALASSPVVAQEERDTLAKYWQTQAQAAEAHLSTLQAELTAAQQREAFYEMHTAKQANELVEVTIQRDKWLKAFNESEQFQNGPTKRAEAAEAELKHFKTQYTLSGGLPTMIDLENDVVALKVQLRKVQEIVVAAQTVWDRFTQDEAQGYRSRDRQYAIEVLGHALRAVPKE